MKQELNIGILYIATGRYSVFWDDFYASCERFFLPSVKKTYFFFTDDPSIQVRGNVVKVEHQFRGWPEETLLRWDTFLKVESQLEKMDYLYFINGTMAPRDYIGEEILPTVVQGLMVTLHPGFYGVDRSLYTYEKRMGSKAFIPDNEGEYYFMGGFNGGRSQDFLHMVHALDDATKTDLANGLIAEWHDESHLNRYMIGKNPLILEPNYGFPEKLCFNQEHLKPLQNRIKLVIKDKNGPEYGGHSWLRNEHSTKHVVKLWGGLGNQMFQYAFGQALANQCSVKVAYDASWFEEMRSLDWQHAVERRYGLSAFNAAVCFATSSQITECCPKRLVRHSRLPGEIRKWFNIPKYKVLSGKILERQENVYDKTLLEAKSFGYYEGYYQTEKYFKSIRSQLLEAFSLADPLNQENQLMLKQIREHNAISLHVRRGDYVQLADIYGVCSSVYYQNAVEYMLSHVQNPYFFIFSDDTEWVRDHLKLDIDCTIVDINDEKTAHWDLELMKNCQHNIIANSSFSWWGAWLNANPEKIVVVPQQWFADGRATDVICEDWISIGG